jgi:hypothetical protein
VAKVDRTRSMNAIINHQIRVAKMQLKRDPKTDLTVLWRSAIDQLVQVNLAHANLKEKISTDELIRRSRGLAWSFERFRDRVLAS